MAAVTRSHYLMLNYVIMAIHNLLIVLGLTATGLAGNTLYWAAGSSDSSELYLLVPSALVTDDPPVHPNIKLYPKGFVLLGTQLVAAASVLTILIASVTMILIYSWSIRPTKRGFLTPNYSTRFTILILVSITTAVLLLAALVISWPERYTAPSIEFSSNTISSDNVYQPTRQTPESWLLKLSACVDGSSNRKPLRDIYILAATGRILISPILGFQLCAFFLLLVLRERMKVGARPPMRVRKLRSGLVERAYADRQWYIAGEKDDEAENDPLGSFNYRPMYPVDGSGQHDELERPRIWRMQAMVDMQPGFVEEVEEVNRHGRTKIRDSAVGPTERTALVYSETDADVDIVEQYRRLVDYSAHPAMLPDDS